MTINMNISHIKTLVQIQEFLQGVSQLQLEPGSKAEVYKWLEKLLLDIKYRKLKKKEKGMVKLFVKKVTGYSLVQIKRLLKKFRNGTLKWGKWQKGCFSLIYDETDIDLLHKVDEAHRLSGPATSKILKREYEVFSKSEYENLKNISVAHIYNLRKRPNYLRRGKIFEETKTVQASIGKRMKPRPENRIGFLRVDSVHQGDLKGKKGVYFINMVDEITQNEYVFCVAAISELYLRVVLEELMKICPFIIINFHSDNGSEYINKVVASILNGLHINQTKSRSRKHNDNALVETKNGSIIRKTFGYFHIPATEVNANLINEFCVKWLNPYLNYHRPCGFATSKIDHKGKEKKIYENYTTPYEKWKSLKNPEQYLQTGKSFEELDRLAYAKSDTEFALEMNEAKATMMRRLRL